MSVASDLNTLQASLDAALASEDYAGARLLALRVKAKLIAMPDATGLASSGIRWDRAAIDSLITNLTQLEATAGSSSGDSIRRTKIKYVLPDDEDEC